MACGSQNIIDEVIFDCSTLFPLYVLPSFSSSNFMKEDVLSEILMKSSYLGAMTVTGEIEATKINAATIAVHVRRRMKPPVPQQSIGNFYLVTTANWPESESIVLNYNGLAGKQISRVTNEDEQ
ncbi:hypothetical protein Peur_070435 [Populus x canadensis]|uniref:Uncharacterized protein n=1 Tax=Populus deltoides TaxID=3696 RepID=A0A8T2WZ76_POPDE|nr:hypothetical protein H0E87_027485 [Populus deltoides]